MSVDYGCIFTHVNFSSKHVCMFCAKTTLKTVHRFARHSVCGRAYLNSLVQRPWSMVQSLLRQHPQLQVEPIQRPWWLTMTAVTSDPFNFVTEVKNNSTFSLKGAAEYCIGKMRPKQLLVWLIHCSSKPVKGACSTSEDKHRQAELWEVFAFTGLFTTPSTSQLEFLQDINQLMAGLMDNINYNN